MKPVRKNMKVSVDSDRKIHDYENKDKFENVLKQIPVPEIENELFPRTANVDPTPSYGIILVYDAGDTLEYFSTQMRATVEFSEFIKCGPREEYLYEYMCLMTEHERELILTHSHKSLWTDLLLDEARPFEGIRPGIKSIYQIYQPYFERLLELTESNISEPQWTFPKGRFKKGDSTCLQSALRELHEEANIEIDEIILLHDFSFVDIYKGSNHITYSTSYYVLQIREKPEPIQIPSDNIISETCLSNDMQDYCWISMKKSLPGSKSHTPLPDRLDKLLCKVHDTIRHKMSRHT